MFKLTRFSAYTLGRAARRISEIVLAIIPIVSIVLIILTAQLYFWAPSKVTPPPYTDSVATQVAVLQSEVVGLRQQMVVISQTIGAGQTPAPDVAVLRGGLDTVDKRLAVVEQAVVDNPGRALALTLLSRDMENLKGTYQAEIRETKNEVMRLYDLGKWFLGLMFTMAIGLFTLAISNLLKKPEK